MSALYDLKQYTVGFHNRHLLQLQLGNFCNWISSTRMSILLKRRVLVIFCIVIVTAEFPYLSLSTYLVQCSKKISSSNFYYWFTDFVHSHKPRPSLFKKYIKDCLTFQWPWPTYVKVIIKYEPGTSKNLQIVILKQLILMKWIAI